MANTTNLETLRRLSHLFADEKYCAFHYETTGGFLKSVVLVKPVLRLESGRTVIKGREPFETNSPLSFGLDEVSTIRPQSDREVWVRKDMWEFLIFKRKPRTRRPRHTSWV